MFLVLGLGIGVNLSAQSEESLIPPWIKNTARFWVDGNVSDREFLSALQYLIDKNILIVKEQSPKTEPQKSSCLGNTLCLTSTVQTIVDGDTIYVEGYKIRLSLTNTPEKNEVGFSEATEFTKNLCSIGSTIVIDQDDKQPYDVYGRLVGKVYCNGKLLNSELLQSGHANILTQYCSKSEFSGESWAQQYGCGSKSATPQATNAIPQSTSPAKCDPSYPDVCIAPYPPDLNCGDIPYRNFKVLPPDPHKFDGNKDGIGCEK